MDKNKVKRFAISHIKIYYKRAMIQTAVKPRIEMNEQHRKKHLETDPNPYVLLNGNKRGSIEKVGKVQRFH